MKIFLMQKVSSEKKKINVPMNEAKLQPMLLNAGQLPVLLRSSGWSKRPTMLLKALAFLRAEGRRMF
jgi:hypothetical protein